MLRGNDTRADRQDEKHKYHDGADHNGIRKERFGHGKLNGHDRREPQHVLKAKFHSCDANSIPLWSFSLFQGRLHSAVPRRSVVFVDDFLIFGIAFLTITILESRTSIFVECFSRRAVLFP